MKKLVIVPTLLTLGNAVCGFAALLTASKVNPQDPQTATHLAQAAWLLFAAMIFDALDGYAARLSKTASDFGGQLDSLCDAVSFGVAPAYLLMQLMLFTSLDTLQRQGVAVIAALYMCCAILRLARFNVENNPDPAYHKRFKGLPSPAAAGCVASLAILHNGLPRIAGLGAWPVQNWVLLWAPLGTLIVSLLMVSRYSYPHMTKQLLRGRRRFSYLVQVVVLIALVVLTREVTIAVLFWGYALLIPVLTLVGTILRNKNAGSATMDEVYRRG